MAHSIDVVQKTHLGSFIYYLRKIFWKIKISNPLIRTRTYAFSFSENFYVRTKWIWVWHKTKNFGFRVLSIWLFVLPLKKSLVYVRGFARKKWKTLVEECYFHVFFTCFVIFMFFKLYRWYQIVQSINCNAHYIFMGKTLTAKSRLLFL